MIISLLIFSIFSLVASCIFCWLLLIILREKKILDKPNERSSHSSPTPVGAGLVVCGIIGISIISIWLIDFFSKNILSHKIPFVVCILLILTFISWQDDKKNIQPILRLCFHSIAVTAGIFTLTDTGNVFLGMFPKYIDILVTVFLWVWIINLTNFMDGIDGISAIEIISICLGVIAVIIFSNYLLNINIYSENFYIIAVCLITAASMIGFLFWNWHPAKIFLGDAGSVPLGFLLGWILFEIIGKGFWHAALIIPLYYTMDASITLIKRFIKRENILKAHRKHFYQQANEKKLSHSFISSTILCLNIILISISLITICFPSTSFITTLVGIFSTVIVLYFFGKNRLKNELS